MEKNEKMESKETTPTQPEANREKEQAVKPETKPEQTAAADPKPAPKPKPKPKPDPRAKLYKSDHKPFRINSSPHLSTVDSVPKIMWSVIAALIPAVIMALYFFGWAALVLIATCTITALVTELVINKMKGEVISIKDGSAAITGLLLALTLPPALSLTSAALGTIFAIAIGKHVFGGLGYNIFNPALLGRAFLQASFPVAMTTWTFPSTEKYAAIDAVTGATPLGQFKFESIISEYGDMLIGNIGGSLGETSAIAILIGGIFLLIKKYADWRIPVSYLATVFVFTGIFWLVDSSKFPDPINVNFSAASGQVLLVMLVFIITVILWLTTPIHKIPTPVISFIPITIFAVARVMGPDDIRALNWDVLLLLTGGL